MTAQDSDTRTKRDRRPYITKIGMDALVQRADGSTINFGDAIYHPENVEEARQYAADEFAALPASQDRGGLRAALDAARTLLNAKSGPYNYASQPQREEIHRAEAVWTRWLDTLAATPDPSAGDVARLAGCHCSDALLARSGHDWRCQYAPVRASGSQEDPA